MTQPLSVARATIHRLGSLHRRAHLALGASADMGVHGAVRDYHLGPERELPLPVERLDRALARHQDRCPTAASLRGAVAVSWTAEIEET